MLLFISFPIFSTNYAGSLPAGLEETFFKRKRITIRSPLEHYERTDGMLDFGTGKNKVHWAGKQSRCASEFTHFAPQIR